MNYIGQKCVVCSEVFTENDDIVVCPECGSPHHRECYRKQNMCGNSSFHADNIKWRNDITAIPSLINPEETVLFCPRCRYPNKVSETACHNCGAELNFKNRNEKSDNSDEDNYFFTEPFNYLGYNMSEDIDGVTLQEVSDFVSVNQMYYIPLFKRMKDTGIKLSLNVLCFLFPPFFFANRRMWGWAVITAIIMVILGIPFAVTAFAASIMENGEADIFSLETAQFIYEYRNLLSNMIDICNAADLIMRVVLCLFGNWIYFRFVIKSVKRIRKNIGDAVNSSLLSSLGGTKPVNLIFITLIFFGISIAALIGSAFLIDFFIILKEFS